MEKRVVSSPQATVKRVPSLAAASSGLGLPGSSAPLFAACSIQFRTNGFGEEASARLEPTASPLLILFAELSSDFLLSFSMETCLHRDKREISGSPDKKEKRHRASAFGSERGKKKRTILWLQMQWRWWLRVWRYGCPPRTASTAVTETGVGANKNTVRRRSVHRSRPACENETWGVVSGKKRRKMGKGLRAEEARKVGIF